MTTRRNSTKTDEGQALRDRHDERLGKKVPYKGQSEFVNYTLDKEEREYLKRTEWSYVQADDVMLKLIEEGYSIAISYDDYSACYMVLLRPKYTGNANTGYLLSGRGSTPLKALKQVSYIHWEIFDKDWAAHYQGKGKPEIDD